MYTQALNTSAEERDRGRRAAQFQARIDAEGASNERLDAGGLPQSR
jgi:hypothetical protein